MNKLPYQQSLLKYYELKDTLVKDVAYFIVNKQLFNKANISKEFKINIDRVNVITLILSHANIINITNKAPVEIMIEHEYQLDSLFDQLSRIFEYPRIPELDIEDNASEKVDIKELDSLFEEAVQIIVQHQQGSTSLLQRRLNLGYNRAGKLIDQLEKAGIVGSFKGSKAREVLIADVLQLEDKLSELRGE